MGFGSAIIAAEQQREAQEHERATHAADAALIANVHSPADLAAARGMLTRLSGRTHQVCTGVCVVFPGGRATTFHELTGVRFRTLGPSVIEDYLARVNPLDKAGSYGIQEHGAMIIEGIEGAFDNVMGLPVAALAAVLGRGMRAAAAQGG